MASTTVVSMIDRLVVFAVDKLFTVVDLTQIDEPSRSALKGKADEVFRGPDSRL